MKKDVALSVSQSNGPALVMNEDYVITTVYQALYTKMNDPYSDRGVDLSTIKYKSIEQCTPYRDLIKENLKKFTDIRCNKVNFTLNKGRLYIGLEVVYNDKTYNLMVDSEENSIFSLNNAK